MDQADPNSLSLGMVPSAYRVGWALFPLPRVEWAELAGEIEVALPAAM